MSKGTASSWAVWAVILIILAAAPASAQDSHCAPATALLEMIKARWGEVPALRGTIRDGSLFRVLVDPKDHSWTALIVTGSGVACVLGSGDDLETETVKPGDPS